jgi:thiamine-monophosphate kinase
MDEFFLIDTCFKPLAHNFPGSLNLTDDAAIIAVPPGHELVTTTDAISEGVHFIGNEDAALIAKKLLRVNLSDLAAMGAKPLCYVLTIMLPKNTKAAWVKRFARGLAEDQKLFRIHLAGGDTVSTRGTKSFSITAFGTVAKGKSLKRSSAKTGDSIYVSGTLGDSALGLRFRNNAFLFKRYLLPEPRLALGQKLVGTANACMDISDGLVQDLGHICRASKAGAKLYRDKLPLSQAAQKLIKKDQKLWELVLGGGDDYELLFTVPASKKAALKKLSAALKLPLTEIGTITKGKEVKVLDENGKMLKLKRKGFQHF